MTRHERATVDLAAASDLTVTASVVRTGARPWQQMWSRVLRGRDAVDAIYAGTFEPRDDRAWDDAFTTALVNVTHLADWLDADPATALPPDVAKTFARHDAVLRVAVAFANTSKHHTRDHGPTARIIEITSGARNEIVVELAQASGTTTYDARALVHDCVAAWEGYLAARGLTP